MGEIAEKNDLTSGMRFETHDGHVIELYHRVQGDGAYWYVFDIRGGRRRISGSRIHSRDLKTRINA